MNANKALGIIGILMIMLTFLATPSFGALAITDPDNMPTYVAPTDDNPEAQVDQACPCATDWKNHGEYVSCVSQKVKELYQDGQVTGEEGSALVSKKARVDCGKAPRDPQGKKK